MRKPIKYVEKAAVTAAKGAWVVFDRLNRVNPNPSPTPKWSDKPLLKSYEKTKPPLGWPRTTDSLCPKCVPEIRQQILDGHLPHEVLMNEKVGEIKAQIINERPYAEWLKQYLVHLKDLPAAPELPAPEPVALANVQIEAAEQPSFAPPTSATARIARPASSAERCANPFQSRVGAIPIRR